MFSDFEILRQQQEREEKLLNEFIIANKILIDIYMKDVLVEEARRDDRIPSDAFFSDYNIMPKLTGSFNPKIAVRIDFLDGENNILTKWAYISFVELDLYRRTITNEK